MKRLQAGVRPYLPTRAEGKVRHSNKMKKILPEAREEGPSLVAGNFASPVGMLKTEKCT